MNMVFVSAEKPYSAQIGKLSSITVTSSMSVLFADKFIIYVLLQIIQNK